MIPIHPVLVHFALALTIFGLVLEAIAVFGGRAELSRVARINFLAGVMAMLLAVPAGFFDHGQWHEAVPHGHGQADLMELHENLGIGLLVYFVLLGVWRLRLPRQATRSFVALGLVGVAVLMFQGHLGGRLVFQQAVGVYPVEQRVSEHGKNGDSKTRSGPHHDSLDSAPATTGETAQPHRHVHDSLD